jgi:hypothetical protein
MGFAFYYRSEQPVPEAKAKAVTHAAHDLCRGRSWLMCEPVCFVPGGQDGHLLGASKPNFGPHPDDATEAAISGLPDGTTSDLLDILCRLSREYGVDWEVGHDHSNGPIGYIRAGVCDEEVETEAVAFADIGDILGGEMDN